jgi:IS30 family transposase
VWSSHRV